MKINQILVGTSLMLMISFLNLAQVSTQETFPTGDRAITIIFDLKLAKDSRAQALLGKNNDVYLWSGAGTSADGNAFEYQPAGQTNFNSVFSPGTMTSLGNDKWSITLTPRSYFNVPEGKPILKLGLLLKNGAGTAQTEDFILNLFSGDLLVKWLNPSTKYSVYSKNTDLLIRGKFSATVSGTISNNGTNIATITNTDSVRINFNTGNTAGQKHELILNISNASHSLVDTLILQNKPDVLEESPSLNLSPGVNYVGDRVYLSFYAPLKSYVYVLGDFNNFEKSPEYLMKKYPNEDKFWIDLGEFSDHQEHIYQYLIDDELTLADPMANKILDKNNDQYIPSSTYPNIPSFPSRAKGQFASTFQTGQVPYSWEIQEFQRPEKKNLNIYELLVRDFSANGNYKTLIDSLNYFKNLGINAIELMPVMEFSGNDSWGYNPIFMQALDKAYGTPNDFKALIDSAHKNGIAIILDIVFNQQDWGNPYVQMYWDGSKPTANSPFFNISATHPYSVFFDMNHESSATQWFVDNVIKYWLNEYKVDGFRFDLSKGFTQKKSGSDVGAWGQYDQSRVNILKRIYNQVRTYDESAYLILEHFADNSEELELGSIGFMLWANGHFDMTAILKGESRNYTNLDYQSRSFSQPQLVGYIESHDEERLMVEMNASAYSFAQKINRMKLGAGLMYAVPGPKMFWQFGELGYDITIENNGRTGKKPIKWDYYTNNDRKSLYNLYSELGKLKLNYPSFNHSTNLQTSSNFKRITNSSADTTWFYIANSGNSGYSGNITFPSSGKWYDYFAKDSLEISEATNPIVLSAGEFHLFVNKPILSSIDNLSQWTIPNLRVLANKEAPVLNFKAFPNPSNGNLTIEWYGQSDENKNFSLIDLNGQILYNWIFPQFKGQKNSQSIQINPKNLAGFFLLKSENEILKILVK
ncbi:MAG: hypothetical protein RIR51_832 [Bacteroidota bacterium]